MAKSGSPSSSIVIKSEKLMEPPEESTSQSFFSTEIKTEQISEPAADGSPSTLIVVKCEKLMETTEEYTSPPFSSTEIKTEQHMSFKPPTDDDGNVIWMKEEPMDSEETPLPDDENVVWVKEEPLDSEETPLPDCGEGPITIKWEDEGIVEEAGKYLCFYCRQACDSLLKIKMHIKKKHTDQYKRGNLMCVLQLESNLSRGNTISANISDEQLRPEGSRRRKRDEAEERRVRRWTSSELLSAILSSGEEDNGPLYPEEEVWLPQGYSGSGSEDSECEGSDEILEMVIPPRDVPRPAAALVFRDNPPPGRTPIPFTGPRGLHIDPPTENTPYGWFRLLFTMELLSHLVAETNAYAVNLFCQSTTPRARISQWKDITIAELELFLALLFLMGIVPLPHISLYWKRLEHVYDFPCFYKAMSRDRFLVILRCIHFARNPGEGGPTPQDPLYKIRPLLNATIDRLRHVYYPEKELSLDESMLLWRGGLGFRQFNPKKRHKYGIKLYMLTEPNGYVLDLLVYCGAKDPDVGGSGHTEKVVRKLMERYLHVGHSLYMNNNSVNMATELYHNHTYTTGTLKKSRQGSPPAVVYKTLARGESVQQFTDDGICVMKWRDRRDVLMISSEFSSRPVTVTLRGGQTTQKPEIITKYNQHMGGVDRADQLLSYYPLERNTLRWYLKVGIHIFHILMNNTTILFNKYSTKSNVTSLQFRQHVIQSIIAKNTPPSPPRVIPLPGFVHLPSFGTNRIRCQECSKNRVRKMVRSFCPDCPQRRRTATGPSYPIGLCIENCFRTYHNY